MTAFPRIRHLALLLPLLLVGCGKNVYLDDDEGAPQPAATAGEHPDHLSLPYALGTRVRITASGGGGEDQTGWRLESQSPAVFTIDKLALEEKRLVADCSAAGEGTARIRLLDQGGAERRAATVTVKAPDRARALAHGPLRVLGRQETSFSAAEVTEPRIVQGGTGVFALGYYRGEERLYGRGIAAAPALAQLKVENQTTAGFATNEWLFLSPMIAGRFELKLQQGQRTLLTLPVVSVAETEVASVSLVEEKTADRKEEQEIWVLLQARDGAGRDVYGVYGDWTLGGVPQLGKDGAAAGQKGDLYRYSYAAAAAPRELVATRGAGRAALQVSAQKGYVATTTYLGCAAAPGGAPAGAAGLAVAVSSVLLFALGLRRRRRPG